MSYTHKNGEVEFAAFAESQEFDKPREKCGVVGIITEQPGKTAELTLGALSALQHRGYDAAGGMLHNAEINMFDGIKGLGTVHETFSEGAAQLAEKAPRSRLGIGHVRYVTEGDSDAVGPCETPDGQIVLAHNGNVDNAHEVAVSYGVSPADCSNDSVAVTLALNKRTKELGDLVPAMQEVLPKLEGAYSLVVSDGQKLVGVRDPNAIRPLSIGRLPEQGFVLASETVALDAVGAEWVRDVEPGEIVAIDQDHMERGIYSHRIDKPRFKQLCGLEVAYLMNPDSKLGDDRFKIGELRQLLGRQLAAEHQLENPDKYVVVGVPSSGINAAEGYADELGMNYQQLIQKNPDFIKRSFLAPDQPARERINNEKLIFDPDEIAGKDMVIVDDSVIRGDVASNLISRLRKAGAGEIHLRIPFPIMDKGCHLGVATSRQEDLLAHEQTLEEMTQEIGADSLEFISTEGFEKALAKRVGGLCLGCAGRDFPVAPIGKRSLALV